MKSPTVSSEMTISSIEARVYSCDFKKIALKFGGGQNIKRDLVLTKVICSDGTIGYGESHHALAPTAVAEIINYSISPFLIGKSPFAVEAIWEKIYRHQVVTYGMGTAALIALSGVDIALWDIRGKILGLPIYKLLGGHRQKIECYAGGLSLGYQTLDGLEKEVGKIVENGFSSIKIRVGEEVNQDAKRVTYIRKKFGNELQIAVDAATRYSKNEMNDVIRYCNDNNVLWLEEPFTPDDIEGYCEIKKRIKVPIAAGENHYTKTAFKELITNNAVDIIQPDCTKTGGITETKKISDLASAWHIPVAPHTSQSVISTAAILHILCSIPNGYIYEADLAAINPFRDKIVSNPFSIEDGFIEINDKPGLGIEIIEDELNKYNGIAGPCYLPKDG